MSSALRKKLMAVAVALSLPLISGCGSNASDVAGVGQGVGTPGVPGLGVGGCAPLNAQIPFMAMGATTYNNGGGIAAGLIPGSSQIGQVTVGGSVAGGAGQYMGMNNIGSQITMSVTNTAQGQAAPYPTQQYGTGTLTATGFLTVGPMEQQQVFDKIAMGQLQLPGVNQGMAQPGMPNQVGSTGQICVSQLAFHLNKAPYTNQLYMGKVYLYLNNTQQYVEVWF